jgi:DNA (cytosine-5)-methyltransferase 1
VAAYYNELDPYAAQWLRNLIAAGHIAPGDVDERDIRDVKPDELDGYSQCHFFAGIGGWSAALRMADWPDSRPVWTGSCPCQPFSAAGSRLGFADDRHLWPHWFWLIEQCQPAIVFGEQVAGAASWLDLVLSDLESQDYACGAAILPAAGVGAPHIRNRFWFVAHADSQSEHDGAVHAEVAALSEPLADPNPERRPYSGGITAPASRADVGEAACLGGGAPRAEARWPAEPDVGRVVDGLPNGMEQLRAYGNAIVPQVAAEFISAALKE